MKEYLVYFEEFMLTCEYNKLTIMGHFVGGYRDALKFHPGEEITFNPQAFVQSRPESMQPFLEKILHLQIFQEVIAL